MIDASFMTSKELRKIERMDLLILDDFGLQSFDTTARMNVLDVIVEDRYSKRFTIITSKVRVKEWYNVIGEKTVAN